MQQVHINAALASLDCLAAGRGAEIDRASLSADDLAFLTDLPMTARRNFDQSAITIPQAHRLHQILNSAKRTSAVAPGIVRCA